MKKILKRPSLHSFDLQRYEGRVIAVILLLFCLVPLAVSSKVVINVLTLVLLYIILVSSLNVVNGYSGQFNVGQAGFYCIGAYTAAILSTRFGWSIWILLPVSGIMTAVCSLVLSVPTAKLKGMYFTIVTPGFSEIVRQLCLNWTSLTRGPRGISGIATPSFFGLDIPRSTFFYYLLIGADGHYAAVHQSGSSFTGRSGMAFYS